MTQGPVGLFSEGHMTGRCSFWSGPAPSNPAPLRVFLMQWLSVVAVVQKVSQVGPYPLRHAAGCHLGPPRKWTLS